MSVSDNYAPTRDSGNGSTTLFTANWSALNSSYVNVYLEDKTTGVQTLQTEGEDYAVVVNTSSVQVTFTTAPASTEYAVIARSVTKDQQTPYRTSSGFDGSNTETSFDKLTLIAQELRDEIDRSLRFQLASGKVGSLPTPTDGYGLVWDGTTGAIRNTTSSLANLEGDAETVADNIADISAVAAIDSNVTTVAGISANVTTVAGISANVTTVAGISANVTTVAGISANVTTVAGLSSEIAILAAISSDITDAANNIPKANRSATSAPTTGDDSDDDYATGSLWVDVTNDKAYICLDASVGAAVWTEITQSGTGDAWGDAVDADIVPDADGTRDLGSTANRFAEAHIDSLDVAGSTTITSILDEDTMSSDSATALATQQSIKAYVDNNSGVTQAVQADIEAETDEDTYVPPDMIKYSPGVAKAWVQFNGTGTVTINASYNVSSITDNGTGQYAINFTTSMSSSNYAVVGGVKISNSTSISGSDANCSQFIGRPSSTSQALVFCSQTTSTSGLDAYFVSASIFADL